MNQFHYDFIRQRNDEILQSILLEKEIQSITPRRTGLRIRLLFLLSDTLLNLGVWIRPDELRIFVPERSLDDCAPLANCS